jgi:hypothetical protein
MKKHFRRHKIKYFASFFASVILVFLAQSSLLPNTPKAVFSFDPDTIQLAVGATTSVAVHVAASTPINAVEGTLVIPESIKIVDVTYTQTPVDLWVEAPSVVDGRISWSGGFTDAGGWKGEETIFSIVIQSDDATSTAIHIENAIALQHDGKGTPIAPEIRTLAIEPIRGHDQATASAGGSGGGSSMSFSDLSYMSGLLWKKSYEPDYDLNGDGAITLSDVSIGLLRLLK